MNELEKRIRIPTFQAEAFIEGVPPMKLRSWGERTPYEPLSILRLCIAGGSLLIHVSIYETRPEPESTFHCVIAPQGSGEPLQIRMTPEDFEQLPVLPKVGLVRDGGENLEGVYWGGLLRLPREWLETTIGNALLECEVPLTCNFYHTSVRPGQEHTISLFPSQRLGKLFRED